MTDTTTTIAGSNVCLIEGCNDRATRDGFCAGHHYLFDRFRSLERAMQRAGKLWRKVHTESFVNYLIARGYDSESADAGFVGNSFEDVWQTMKKRAPAPWPECAECGGESDRLDRRNSRYCSDKCRQKAYRKRVTDKAPPRAAKRNGTRKRDASRSESAPQSVTHSVEAA